MRTFFLHDLATIGGKLKRKVTAKAPGQPSFLEDLGLFIAQVAFVPLAALTLFPDIRQEALEHYDFSEIMITLFGNNLITDAVFWILLIVSGFLTYGVAVGSPEGKLTSYGTIFLVLLFILGLPLTLGFAAMAFVTFAVGGPGVLPLMWKGLLFFGFAWLWFNAGSSR